MFTAFGRVGQLLGQLRVLVFGSLADLSPFARLQLPADWGLWDLAEWQAKHDEATDARNVLSSADGLRNCNAACA